MDDTAAFEPDYIEVDHNGQRILFIEDENLMEMEVGEQQSHEFPATSDEEIESNATGSQRNNNAAVQIVNGRRTVGALGSAHASQQMRGDGLEKLPDSIEAGPSSAKPKDPKLTRTLEIVQTILVKKGVIDTSLTEQELQDLLADEELDLACVEEDRVICPGTSGRNISQPTAPKVQRTETGRIEQPHRQPQPVLEKEPRKTPGKRNNNLTTSVGPSNSEVTIYKRAVQQIAPDLEEKIDQFINDAHLSQTEDSSRKVLSSSEELMDTSDELNINNQSGEYVRQENPEFSGNIDYTSLNEPPVKFFTEPEVVEDPMQVAQEQADEMYRESERLKARVYEITGRGKTNPDSVTNNKVNEIALMDNNYQMLDNHVDDILRCKILSFEYIDFSKLLVKNRNVRADEQRLEIVSRNGMTFLSPVSERDSLQVTGFGRWEQAFRVYANIITTKYPAKSPELLQYSHTIHMASTAYIWENVYSYDKEFRHHIGRNPTKAWNVILQQAWTMLLKDRLRGEGSTSGNKTSNGAGNNSKMHKRGEPCRRFNRGICTFGLSCKFDHRCSVPKCGKFGHGAHMCRMREDKQDKSDQSNRRESVQKANKLYEIRR